MVEFFITGQGATRRPRWLISTSATILLGVLILPVIVQAQEDPSGGWVARLDQDNDDRGPGEPYGDYAGYPINNASRLGADSFNENFLELPEVRCQPHPSDYAWRSPYNIRIWRDVDLDTQQVTAYHVYFQYMQGLMTIYMDGRAHPPADARHTWAGFSTGNWQGDDLVVTTTHLKEGWLNLDHLTRSDQATVSTHLLRHGQYLDVTVIDYDPLYLTEPLIRSVDFVSDPRIQMLPFTCEPANTLDIPEGTIPHFLPGQNPNLHQFADDYGIPFQATRGGAETMYPEYLEKMAKMPRTAPKPIKEQ